MSASPVLQYRIVPVTRASLASRFRLLAIATVTVSLVIFGPLISAGERSVRAENRLSLNSGKALQLKLSTTLTHRTGGLSDATGVQP